MYKILNHSTRDPMHLCPLGSHFHGTDFSIYYQVSQLQCWRQTHHQATFLTRPSATFYNIHYCCFLYGTGFSKMNSTWTKNYVKQFFSSKQIVCIQKVHQMPLNEQIHIQLKGRFMVVKRICIEIVIFLEEILAQPTMYVLQIILR